MNVRKFLAAAAVIMAVQAPVLADVKDAATDAEIGMALAQEGGAVFPIGQPSTAYAKYFTGRSFLYMMEREGVKHWHGAQNSSWFQHIAIMEPGASTEWLEPVNPAEYAKLY